MDTFLAWPYALLFIYFQFTYTQAEAVVTFKPRKTDSNQFVLVALSYKYFQATAFSYVERTKLWNP